MALKDLRGQSFPIISNAVHRSYILNSPILIRRDTHRCRWENKYGQNMTRKFLSYAQELLGRSDLLKLRLYSLLLKAS